MFLDSTFRPARGLASPHLQSIYASLLRPTRTPPLVRQRLETPDGDFLDLDRLMADPRAPHLLVLHGLEGSSRAGYVAATVRAAAARGWGAVALNFRSCSGELNRQPRFYHSGETGDASFVLDRLRAEVRGPWLGIGFSLGGNVLLRLLAESGAGCPLRAAAAVSVPFDLLRCARALDRPGSGWMALYRHVFLRSLKRKAIEKARCHPGLLDEARIRAVRGIEAYDDAVTAPLHGWASAVDYYAACSSGPALGRIARPTLLISAEDDPLAPASALPPDVDENPHLTVLRTARGGHVGFVQGSLLRPRFWAEERAVQFLGEQR
jgi:predicted alpha/beta-fold hydrolase